MASSFGMWGRGSFAVLGLTWLALGVGCGGDDQPGGPDGGTSVDAGASADAMNPADAGPDYSEADWLFEPDRLLEVAVEIGQSDWDRLRLQGRNILEILGESCGLTPAVSPFVYVPATVTIEGTRIEQVGVRKKGFLGSLHDTKPSLKFKFDEYVVNQRYSALRRLTLNNAVQDPSLLNQCLGYDLFNKAGVPAPRCNFARVTVNGEALGIYVHVENVKKPFLGRNFADDGGNLYEGTLSDFRAAWFGTFERKTNKSMPRGTEDRSDLQAVLDALALDDAAMYAALEQLIDLDEFISFWAMETMVSHWDGYSGNNANNYFIYGDPVTGLMSFMPWGADQLFGTSPQLPVAATRSALTHRLFLYTPARQRYLTRFGELLDQVWDDAALLSEIDRMQALVVASVPADELQAFTDAIAALRLSIDGREQQLRDALAGAGPGDVQSLGEQLCLSEDGTVDATFNVVWGGGGATNVAVNMVIAGASIPLTSQAAFAGASEDVPDQSVLYLTGKVSPTRTAVLYVSMPDAKLVPGVVQVGSADVESVVFFQDDGAADPDKFYFLSGTMNVQRGAATQGATWQGNLQLKVWNVPWL